MIDLTGKRILISRTDSIGDVILTLPICHWIKQNFKGTRVLFLGKTYTRPIIEAYKDVDEFIDWNEFLDIPKSDKKIKFREIGADVIIHVFPNKEIAALAKTLKIPVRVGTSHRMYHLITCTHRIDFTRKRSDKHEAQLNFELLRPFGLKELPDMDEVNKATASFKVPKQELPAEIAQFIEGSEFFILHPKSQGSAKEWPIEHYIELAEALTKKTKKVVFTGTEEEGALFRESLPKNDMILDSTGKMTLAQLIGLISKSSGLVACSTGPLHIAGILNKKAVGIYSPKKPIHPGRWAPLGKQSIPLVFDPECPECKSGKDCDCLKNVSVDQVLEQLL